MSTQAIRPLGGVSAMLLGVSLFWLCPAAAEPQSSAESPQSTADPCLSLADGSGKRIATGFGGSTVGSGTRRECRGETPASAPLAPLPEPEPAPSALVELPVAAPAPQARVRRPPPALPAAAPQEAPATPLPPVPTSPRFASGTVYLDPDQARAPQSAPPLAIKITPERLAATVITGGAAVLLLQSGLWTSLLVLGLPLWRHVDLLPIVEVAGGAQGEAASTAPETHSDRGLAEVLEPAATEHLDRGARP